MPSNGDQKMSTVNRANGMGANRRNGIRRPRRCLQRSDNDAMSGSVMASNRRPDAVMRPITVRPRNTAPCVMNS